MKEELIEVLNKWNLERFYDFEERGYAATPNPYSDGESFITLWLNAHIKIGKKSSKFGSETLFFTFAQNNKALSSNGDIIRLEREMQKLSSEFDKKVKKFFEDLYKKFEKKIKE